MDNSKINAFGGQQKGTDKRRADSIKTEVSGQPRRLGHSRKEACSYISVDEDSQLQTSKCLQLLAVIEGLRGQASLQYVVGHKLFHSRRHCHAACGHKDNV